MLSLFYINVLVNELKRRVKSKYDLMTKKYEKLHSFRKPIQNIVLI